MNQATPSALPSLRLPPSTLFIGLLALAYALPGLFGHAPWKPEDAIGVGIVHQMLEHGRWLIPHLAGEPYLDDGPLYYWVAALLAKLSSFALDMDDGARLASALAVFGTWFFLRDAARELHGRTQADGAMLVLLGCLGLLVHAHEAMAELGLLAGLALAWHGIALAPRKPHKGGIALGLGLLIAFLCKGFAGISAPILTALAVVTISGHWRTGAFAVSLCEALGVLVLPCVLWLLLAGNQGGVWLIAQWSIYSLPSAQGGAYYFKVLTWAAWPAWPVALWLLWDRRDQLSRPGILLPVLATVFSLGVLLCQREMREVHALPLLLPLALLAGAGVERLRRGASNALAWFGAIVFSFFGALVWLGWFAMLTGFPPRIARNFEKLEPGHVASFGVIGFTVALLLSVAWIFILWRSERSVYRSVLYWACGATLVWGLVMTLWLSWIDYGKSYQPVAQSLSAALRKAAPSGAYCIQSSNLGESQRAALDYHAGIMTRRMELNDSGVSARSNEVSERSNEVSERSNAGQQAVRCALLLVQARPDDDDRQWSSQWRRVWEGSRPRDHERYRLYVRVAAKNTR